MLTGTVFVHCIGHPVAAGGWLLMGFEWCLYPFCLRTVCLSVNSVDLVSRADTARQRTSTTSQFCCGHEQLSHVVLHLFSTNLTAASCLPLLASACRNTIVVDYVNEARQLCYESPDHHKVVSADGTLFKPNGNITGVRP
jgi:hypothetical protein